MRGFTFDREFYIPKGAMKVADKETDAVAYVLAKDLGNGRMYYQATAFTGKRRKPDMNYTYRTVEARDEAVKRFFEGRKATLEFKKEQREKRKAKGRGLDVGDVLVAVWGYEQTNIDYYQVTGLIGKTMVEVRKIHGKQVDDPDAHWMTGKCTPDVGNFDTRKEPMRRVAKDGAVKIDDVRTAHKTAKDAVHNWTAYH